MSILTNDERLSMALKRVAAACPGPTDAVIRNTIDKLRADLDAAHDLLRRLKEANGVDGQGWDMQTLYQVHHDATLLLGSAR